MHLLKQKESTLFLLVAALWICTRPYDGIRHDAVIYTGQALHLLKPDQFANDLFFAFGSQDRYTLFSNIYAAAIDLLGLDAAYISLNLIGQALWLTGASLLIRRLLPAPGLWFALAAVFLLPFHYSGGGVFNIGENFLTPRLYAEGFSMLAVTALLDRKYQISAFWWLLATVLHPLTALPIFAIFFCRIVGSRPATGVVIILLSSAAVLLLAKMGIPPASDLLHAVDPEWYQITRERSHWLYADTWGQEYWNQIGLSIALIATAAARGEGPLAEICKGGLFVIICGVAVSVFASETLVSVLLIQLQTWRVIWFAEILACCAAVWLVQRCFERKMPVEIALGYLAALFMIGWIGNAVAAAMLAYLLLPEPISVNVRRLVFWVVVGLLAMSSVGILVAKMAYFVPVLPLMISHPSIELLRIPLSVAIALFLIWALLKQRNDAGRNVLPFLSLAALAAAFSLWDRSGCWESRSALALWNDRDVAQLKKLDRLIGEKETLYWQSKSALEPWVLLQRSSYYSGTQSAGAIFNRETAMEAQRRHVALQQFFDRIKSRSTAPDGTKSGPYRLEREDLALVCRDPALDWLALVTELPGYRGTYITEKTAWYFYRCADFRSGGPDEKALGSVSLVWSESIRAAAVEEDAVAESL